MLANRRLLALVIVVLNVSIPYQVLGQATDRDGRLEQVLQRFPEADIDKDGKLSQQEAQKFLVNRKSGKSNNSKATPAKRSRQNEDLPKPDHADVSYGSHPNNKLDLWLAKTGQPTPLIVFIHGGGFVGGDKSSVSATAIQQALDAGVSIASINYRFRTEASINIVLRDTARAIQYLRFKSDEYKFDKRRVAAFGGSAGAGSSLWLAFRDDLADPTNADPVLRESTRLVAAASNAGQATYDILRWADVLGSQEAMQFYPESTWPAFYGLESLDDLKTEKGQKLRADVDMLGQISKDDPPVFLAAGTNHDALANKGDTNHSPKHSEEIKKRCDEIGVTAILKIGSQVSDNSVEITPIDFLIKHVKN